MDEHPLAPHSEAFFITIDVRLINILRVSLLKCVTPIAAMNPVTKLNTFTVRVGHLRRMLESL